VARERRIHRNLVGVIVLPLQSKQATLKLLDLKGGEVISGLPHPQLNRRATPNC
jgi:hypothetical protein